MSRSWAIPISILIMTTSAFARTPKLHIKLKNNSPAEQQKKAQIERLADEYDLKKFTLTTNILIEDGATSHSKPVLTMGAGYLLNDDRALSVYIHEQGHWVMGDHRRDLRNLYQDLTRRFPGMPADPPQGSGSVQDSYNHLAVIALEWQGLEELIGAERARAVLEFKSTDHYMFLYKTVLANRAAMEGILNRYGIRW